MNFSLDKDRAMELAEKLGLKVSFNNEKSGVILTGSDNKVNLYDFDDFFPEIETLKKEFVTKDKDVFLKQITVKHQVTKVNVQITQTPISPSNSKQLIHSA